MANNSKLVLRPLSITQHNNIEKKRDLIVNEFLKTKKNIQENFLSERLGDISEQWELSDNNK